MGVTDVNLHCLSKRLNSFHKLFQIGATMSHQFEDPTNKNFSRVYSFWRNYLCAVDICSFIQM